MNFSCQVIYGEGLLNKIYTFWKQAALLGILAG
jgi:hypothetical protein